MIKRSYSEFNELHYEIIKKFNEMNFPSNTKSFNMYNQRLVMNADK